MPTREEITDLAEVPAPPGADPWVGGARPETGIEVVPPDPAWPEQYAAVAARVRNALGPRAISVEHVGSTSVPGLVAKPIIDVDLVVADPDDEAAWVPPLEEAGFELVVREPWWHGHRALRGHEPRTNLHVFGPAAPEPVRHRLFRDWLSEQPEDRERYAAAKLAAAEAAHAAGEHVMEYNARKEAVVHDIYGRLFRASGLLPGR